MDFEWDPAKRLANLAKHGLDFEDVTRMDWEQVTIVEDPRFAYGERRFWPSECWMGICIWSPSPGASCPFASSASAARIERKERAMAKAKAKRLPPAFGVPDKDIPEMTGGDFRRARPFLEVFPEFTEAVKKLRGRPRAEHPKVQVTLRLDPEVVNAFKEEGRGWQGRINETLVRAVKRRRAK